jgi:hypothetical protein
LTSRVAFVPATRTQPLRFYDLGSATEGRWGLIDDDAWLAAESAQDIELLYLSHPEFQHAMRGLDPSQTAEAILRRRQVFSADLPSQALGEVALAISRCISALPAGESSKDMVADLLTALATFTCLPRLAHTAPLVLVDYLREGDATVIAEIESPSMLAAHPVDVDGKEQETRRRFAAELGQIQAERDRAADVRFLPYVDVSRTYYVEPPNPDVMKRARFMGEPVRDWREGMILPMPERLAADVKVLGHRLTVVFPATGPFLGALQECTGPQLDVELAERMTEPGLGTYLNQQRLQQAVLRSAAFLVAGTDPELGALLRQQTELEASLLGSWLTRDPNAFLPLSDLPDELSAIVDSATLLVGLCRLRNKPAIADKVEALARAVSHVALQARN